MIPKTTTDYLNLLFDPGELICPGFSPYSTKVCAIDGPELTWGPEYVCVNPLRQHRLDANVTAYRNILLEFDKTSLDDQITFFESTDLPHSALVFSGSKSVHCIISLKEPVATEMEYRRLAKAIYEAIKEHKPDTSCGNPSRFTRLAGAVRRSTGEIQELLRLNKRVSKDELVAWLVRKLGSRQAAAILHGWEPFKTTAVPTPTVEGDKAELTNRSKAFLKTAQAEAGWRTEAMFLLCDAYRSGYSKEEARELLLSVDGYIEPDSERLVDDAYNKVLTSGQLNSRLHAALALKEQKNA